MLATFYLVCFLVGVALSVVSFVGGGLHFGHLHLPLPHGDPGIPHPQARRMEELGMTRLFPTSTSSPLPRFWPGLAAPGFCSPAIRPWW